jgi:nucleoside 2-deoxyribosyltransferase
VKAYIAIKYHPDNSNRPHIEQISEALARNGIESVCVARDLERWGEVHFPPGDLMKKSFAAIDACDLMVVDLSEKGVGVGIEAGYAHARGIPILTIARAGADISTTLQGISQEVFWYESGDALIELFTRIELLHRPRATQC